MKEFDVIAIGSGLAGLTCGALLAKRGKKILYISQEADNYSIGTGPQNSNFPICGYYYDIRSGILKDILEKLGVISSVSFITPAEICKIQIGDFILKCPSDWFEYRDRLIGIFPQYRHKIEEYFKTVDDLAREWQLIIMSDAMPAFNLIPNMVRFQKVKYLDYIDTLFNDTLLKDILSVDITYTKISLAVMAGYISQIFKSAYIAGGYQSIKSLLCKVILENNGEIIHDRKSLSIDEIENERSGYVVSISSIEQFKCRWIVLDHDRYSYKGKRDIGTEQVIHIDERFSKAFVNLNCKGQNSNRGHSNIIKYFPDGDIRKYFLDMESGCQLENYPFMLHFPLCDDIEGEFGSIQIEVPIPAKSTKEEVDRIVSKVLEIAKTEFPEIVGQIISQSIIYPQDIENILHFNKGIQSHWAFSPDEIVKNPINVRPVHQGIYLAGDWGNAFIASGKILAKAINKNDSKFEGIFK